MGSKIRWEKLDLITAFMLLEVKFEKQNYSCTADRLRFLQVHDCTTFSGSGAKKQMFKWFENF